MRRPPKLPRPTPVPRVDVPRLSPAAYAARSGPIVTDGHVLTFVHEAPTATAVLLFVNRITDETDLASSEMEVHGGRWVAAFELGPAWRGSYAFVEHHGADDPPWRRADHVGLRALLDHGVPDPTNPGEVVNRAGRVMSVAALDAAPAQPFVRGRGGARPADDVVAGRPVWVHQAGVGTDLPVVIVLDGEIWLDHHDLAGSLDEAVGAGVLPPHVAVFVSAGSVADRWADAGSRDGLAAFVGGALVPWARERLAVTHDADRTVVVGQSLGGLSALWTVADHSSMVGTAVAQSPSLWLDAPALPPSATVHLEVGLQEWVLLPLARAHAVRLAGDGVDLTFVEYDGGHDYACWRGGLIDALASLLD